MVFAHGDEVLLRAAGAAGVVMGQFTDGVADRVVNSAAHLEEAGWEETKDMFTYFMLCVVMLSNKMCNKTITTII